MRIPIHESNLSVRTPLFVDFATGIPLWRDSPLDLDTIQGFAKDRQCRSYRHPILYEFDNLRRAVADVSVSFVDQKPDKGAIEFSFDKGQTEIRQSIFWCDDQVRYRSSLGLPVRISEEELKLIFPEDRLSEIRRNLHQLGRHGRKNKTKERTEENVRIAFQSLDAQAQDVLLAEALLQCGIDLFFRPRPNTDCEGFCRQLIELQEALVRLEYINRIDDRYFSLNRERFLHQKLGFGAGVFSKIVAPEDQSLMLDIAVIDDWQMPHFVLYQDLFLGNGSLAPTLQREIKNHLFPD